MGLIKSTSSRASAPALFNLADIETSARAMVARARAEADQLLAEAKNEAQRMRTVAHAQGLAAGRTEGLKTGLAQGTAQGLADAKKQALTEQRARLTDLAQSLTQAATSLESMFSQLQEQARTEAVELSLAVAQRVCKTLGRIDRSVVESNLREALRVLVNKQRVRIFIHPSQHEALSELLPQLSLTWPDLQHVELVNDETLSPGGCRLVSGAGEIDASIDGQLDRLSQQLLPPESAKETGDRRPETGDGITSPAAP